MEKSLGIYKITEDFIEFLSDFTPTVRFYTFPERFAERKRFLLTRAIEFFENFQFSHLEDDM